MRHPLGAYPLPLADLNSIALFHALATRPDIFADKYPHTLYVDMVLVLVGFLTLRRWFAIHAFI